MFARSVANANCVLMLHPDGPFRVADVQRYSGEPTYTVVKAALVTLVKLGLAVAGERLGAPVYSANTSALRYDEGYTCALKDLPWEACLTGKGVDLYLIRAIYAHGSMIRRDFSAKSDLDILVVGSLEEEDKIMNAFRPIEAMIGRTVDVHVMPSAELAARRERHDTFVEGAITHGLRVAGVAV